MEVIHHFPPNYPEELSWRPCPFFKGRFSSGAHHLQEDPDEPSGRMLTPALAEPPMRVAWQRRQPSISCVPGTPLVSQGPRVTSAPLTSCPQGPGRRPRRVLLLFERRQRWLQLGRGSARPSQRCWHGDKRVETKEQLRGCGPPPAFEL